MGPDTWFETLEGHPVPQGGFPVTKIFVVDPGRKLLSEDILDIVDPTSAEHVLRTNAGTMDILVSFSGTMSSRGQARKNGFGGPIPRGMEMYGISGHSFWVWNPWHQPLQPTVGRKKRITEKYLRFLEVMGWPLRKKLSPENTLRET